MSDLVDATPGACAQFVQSLGLPELKAKRLLAALGGAAQGEVPPAIVAIKHTRTDVCPSCAAMGCGGWPVALASNRHELFALQAAPGGHAAPAMAAPAAQVIRSPCMRA